MKMKATIHSLAQRRVVIQEKQGGLLGERDADVTCGDNSNDVEESNTGGSSGGSELPKVCDGASGSP